MAIFFMLEGGAPYRLSSAPSTRGAEFSPAACQTQSFFVDESV